MTARFSFIAERLCLDYANTVDWHASDHPGERVQDVNDLLSWAEQAGLLDSETRAALTRHAHVHPRLAVTFLQQARELREVIYRIFAALTHGQAPTQADLNALNAARLEATQHQLFQTGASGYALGWDTPDDLNRVWWPVALDASALLTSPLLGRVGQCADDRGCGWLFLDTSKAGRRRWCVMEDCGNRAKAQRHRHKIRT